MRVESDTLVIGGGIAGLFFALKAATRGSVTLLTKDRLPISNTAFAQGPLFEHACQPQVWMPVRPRNRAAFRRLLKPADIVDLQPQQMPEAMWQKNAG